MSQLSRFERLALPHMDAAFNLAFWLLRSRADAEDVVQESYLRAFRAFGGFTGTEFRPWLLAIVRNAAYRWLGDRRRSANVVSLEEVFRERNGDGPAEYLIADDGPSVEDRLILDAECGRVQRALGALPPMFREVLVLREVEDLSYREIAAISGVPIGTVMSRLSRARGELRKMLAHAAERDEPDAV